VVKEGPAAPYILAEAGNAGAIALASRGRSGFHATFIASAADKVVREANLPVLLVPAVPGRQHIAGRPIVVPRDGSEESERALPVARQLAPARGSEITLLRAFYVTPPATIEITYLPADYLDQIEEGAHAYLANVARPG